MNIKQTSQSNNIAIIGAGASGLFCSILLARKHHKITIFEKNTKLGRKILATGNGRCNISNKNISISNFYSTDIDFVKYTLEQFGYAKFKSYFEDIGFDLVEGKNNKIFPSSLQASSVVDLLVYEAKNLGVEFVTDYNIDDIQFEHNSFTINSGQNKQSFDKVIVATGSYAMPKLGSSQSGYKFAQSFGHNIIEPFASLVQLITKEETKMINGVKLDAQVTLQIDKEMVSKASGDLLFTDYGLSGNSILDISRDAAQALQYGQPNINVIIDIFPTLSKENLISKFTKRLKIAGTKDKYFWLEGLLHKKLIKYIIDNCGISKTKQYANELNKKDIMNLVYYVKNMKFLILSTKGFDTAEVSAGGVDVSQINKQTMESKLQKGLYFIGEVLDVDGQCGGYNLHWAWGSAFVCAQGIK